MRIFKLAKLDAELSCHAYQFKLENVSRTGGGQWKNLTVFLAISCMYFKGRTVTVASTVASNKFWSSMSFQNFTRLSRIKKKNPA
jgi:hypothetical protein